MRIVIDNNILLDALLERQPFCEDSKQILTACADTHEGCLSANSLTDIFYVLRKLIGTASAKDATRKLTGLFEIISVSVDDCVKALSLPIDDFEDALVITCAAKANADCIVTRDNMFLQVESPIAVLHPIKLLEII